SPTPRGDSFVFVDAEQPNQGLRMPELKSHVQRFAGGLREKCNLQNGHVVLVYTGNSTWYPVIILGAICAGGIFTGANPGYTSTELAHQLGTSEATCIVTDSERLSTALQAVKAAGLSKKSIILVDREGQSRSQDGGNGFCSIHDLLECEPYSWEVVRDGAVLAEK
ncbi:hypothetical protein E4U43_006949, partial [Claviceps pusilla]